MDFVRWQAITAIVCAAFGLLLVRGSRGDPKEIQMTVEFLGKALVCSAALTFVIFLISLAWVKLR